MFRSFTAKRFRGIPDLTIGTAATPLARVNLIGGRNNVGKTAMLEAIFLHLGPDNPSLSLVVNAIRGLERFSLDAAEMWGWLFQNAVTESPIELTSVDEFGIQRKLQMTFVDSKAIAALVPSTHSNGTASVSAIAQPTTYTLTNVPGASLSTALVSSELQLAYMYGDRQQVISKAQITSVGTKIERSSIEHGRLGIFLGSRARSLTEDAERFSKLEQVGAETPVLNALKVLDSRINRLALSVIGGTSIIHCDISIGRLIPVMYLGEGAARLLSIVLAIGTARDGVVLIDEIENGFHYSILKEVWNVIAHAARENNVQVFATTHSWECIDAAHQAFGQGENYDFALHRLDRIDGEIRAITYDREALSAATKHVLEVR